jgi:5-formyltetrahydrofolate cyclo-ligase
MSNIKDLIFFPNGGVTAFDEAGQQTGDGKGWMDLYFEYLESQGHNPADIWIEGQLNNGQWKRIIPFKTDSGGWSVNFAEPKPM